MEIVDRVQSPGDAGSNVLGGFSFILGFLVVFRSQQAYSRWWEGGTLLQQLRGEWWNVFSSCIAFCNASPDKQEEVAHFQHRLVRLISMLFGAALSEVSEMDSNIFEFLDLDDFDRNSLNYLAGSHYKCEIVLQWVQRLIVEAHEAHILKIAPPILSRVYNQLGNGIVILNNAEKLNDFPMPFPLSQTVTFMLLLHWMLTALVLGIAVEQIGWSAFISFAVIFAFWSVHYIGLELEQPFGDDANDLPLREMQVDLNTSLRELMHVHARFPPTFTYRPEKHRLLHAERISLGSYLTEICLQSDSEQDARNRHRVRRTRLQSLWSDGSQRTGSWGSMASGRSGAREDARERSSEMSTKDSGSLMRSGGSGMTAVPSIPEEASADLQAAAVQRLRAVTPTPRAAAAARAAEQEHVSSRRPSTYICESCGGPGPERAEAAQDRALSPSAVHAAARATARAAEQERASSRDAGGLASERRGGPEQAGPLQDQAAARSRQDLQGPGDVFEL